MESTHPLSDKTPSLIKTCLTRGDLVIFSKGLISTGVAVGSAPSLLLFQLDFLSIIPWLFCLHSPDEVWGDRNVNALIWVAMRSVASAL